MISDTNFLALKQEWSTLQNQFDSYEKHSLFIKLFSIAVTSILLFAFDVGCWALLISATLWLQDGIWKTFQGRMGERLETLEQSIKQHLKGEQGVELGMQFNSKWNEQRAGFAALVLEYIKQSLKPTVAYPHAILVLVIVFYGNV